MTDSRIPPADIVAISKTLDLSKVKDRYELSSKSEQYYFYFDNKYSLFTKYFEDDFNEYDNFNNIIYGVMDYFSWFFDALYRVKPVTTKAGLVSCYPTILDAWKGRRIEMKPGKFFKFFVPFASDKEIESMVTEFKAINTTPDFELIVSQDESAFVEAYTVDYFPKRSPRLNNGQGYYIKRLDSSCMQGKWEGDKHPARVYASGDFWIAYTKEKNTGKIGSRVIYTAESASNIYSVDDHATEILVNHLKANNIACRSRFEGKKVKRILHPSREHAIQMPYIDGYNYLYKIDDSFMGITEENTNISCCENQGWTYEVKLSDCYCCSERRILNNRVLDSYHDYRDVCDNCLELHYVYSETQEAYIPNHFAYPHPENENDFVTSCWLSRNGYVQCKDSIWRDSESVVYIRGNHYPLDSDEIEYFCGDWWLKNDPELIKAKRGFAIEKVETWGFNWKHDWKYSSFNSTPYLEYSCQVQERLRDNYELDENGIAQRLPELPGLEMSV